MSIAEHPPTQSRARLSTGTVLAVACVIAAVLVAGVQVAHMSDLIDTDAILTAGYAKALLLGYGLAVLAIAVAAALLPAERLWLPVAGAGAIAGAVLLATLTVGTEAWSFGFALLTMAACWRLGRLTLAALRLPPLADTLVCAWLVGAALVGLWVLALGKFGLIEWWSVALPVAALGMSAAPASLEAARSAWATRSEPTRIGAVSAGLVLLLLGLASVWTAAPEIMFDAIYAKAWLPHEWARTGSIDANILHPVMNNAGFSQLIAVPGHLVDAGGVGRYLQWLSVAAIARVMWRLGRAPWGALAAVVVAATPQIFWQATTAFDDAVLALAAVGLAVGVMRLADAQRLPSFAAGVGIGLLAGACVDFKLHLTPLAAGAVIGWLAIRGRDGWLRAAGGAVLGGVAIAAPPFVIRWIDVGNPVLPAMNDVFKSPFWPPVDEKLNLPFLKDPGSLGPLDVVVRSVTDPGALNEAAPVGAYGLLVAALVIALVFLPALRHRSRAALALWAGLVLAALSWYVQFRYLRYLVPAGVVAVAALVIAAPSRRPTRRGELLVIGAIALGAVLLWPATVAQFWNVPGKDIPWEAALHERSDASYERASMPERDAIMAFNRLAPPDAMMMTTAHQRLWLTGDRDLSPDWEVGARLASASALPASEPLLRRYRDLGVTWVLDRPAASVRANPMHAELLQRYGELVWADGGWDLYRLTDRPRAARPLAACDDRLTARPGCWQGTLDGQPGYRLEESPGGIARTVDVCPGRTLVATAQSSGAGGPYTVSVWFESPDPTRGRGTAQAVGGQPASAAATAPPGARRGTVSVVGAPGVTIERVTLGTHGACDGR